MWILRSACYWRSNLFLFPVDCVVSGTVSQRFTCAFDDLCMELVWRSLECVIRSEVTLWELWASVLLVVWWLMFRPVMTLCGWLGEMGEVPRINQSISVLSACQCIPLPFSLSAEADCPVNTQCESVPPRRWCDMQCLNAARDRITIATEWLAHLLGMNQHISASILQRSCSGLQAQTVVCFFFSYEILSGRPTF